MTMGKKKKAGNRSRRRHALTSPTPPDASHPYPNATLDQLPEEPACTDTGTLHGPNFHPELSVRSPGSSRACLSTLPYELQFEIFQYLHDTDHPPMQRKGSYATERQEFEKTSQSLCFLSRNCRQLQYAAQERLYSLPIVLGNNEGYEANIVSLVTVLLDRPELRRHVSHLRLDIPRSRHPYSTNISQSTLERAAAIIRRSRFQPNFKSQWEKELDEGFLRSWFGVLLFLVPNLRCLVLFDPWNKSESDKDEAPDWLLRKMFGVPERPDVPEYFVDVSCIPAFSNLEYLGITANTPPQSLASIPSLKQLEIRPALYWAQCCHRNRLKPFAFPGIRSLRLDYRIYHLRYHRRPIDPRFPIDSSIPLSHLSSFASCLPDLETLELYSDTNEEVRHLTSSKPMPESSRKWETYWSVQLLHQSIMQLPRGLKSLQLPGGPWCDWPIHCSLRFGHLDCLEQLVVSRNALLSNYPGWWPFGRDPPLARGALTTFPASLRLLTILDADCMVAGWLEELVWNQECRVVLADSDGGLIGEEWARV